MSTMTDLPPEMGKALEFLQKATTAVLARLPVLAVPRLALACLRTSWWEKGAPSGHVATQGLRWVPDPMTWPGAVNVRRVELEKSELSLFLSFGRVSPETAAFEQVIGESTGSVETVTRTRIFRSRGVQAGTYHVVAIIEFDLDDVSSTPTAILSRGEGKGELVVSMLDAAMRALLSWFTDELSKGKTQYPFVAARDVDSILRHAGTIEMESVQSAASKKLLTPGDLFVQVDNLSVLRHERAEGRGRIMFVAEPAIRALGGLRFREEVPLWETAWVRKLLELARGPLCLLSDGEKVSALADPADLTKGAGGLSAFTVTFEGQHCWLLSSGTTALMRVSSGIPCLPAEPLQAHRFSAIFRRIFPERAGDTDAVWQIVEAVLSQDHGALVVITDDAEVEARRLSAQGTQVEPKDLSRAEAQASAKIDGALLLDPSGRCHAIGVVLDGAATPAGVASRGARFNSALRYVAEGTHRLAIVRSEDGAVDVLPRLRQQVRRSDVVSALETIRASKEKVTTPELRQLARLLNDYAEAVDLLSREDVLLVIKHLGDTHGIFDEPRSPPVFDPHPTDFLPEPASE